MPLPDETPLDNAIPWVAKHNRQYRESNGAEGHEWKGATTLLLTTMGRSSGRLRQNPLIYVEDGGSYHVVASFGGKPHNPDWYENLAAEPEVRVQVGDRIMDATARTLSADEKAVVWDKCVAMWPAYDEYQQKTDREFPVVAITPA
jgi:deazaflavin-dependent oxidoreductase (nitroreductase family)